MGTVVAARSYDPGMGEAVADRTINRKVVRSFAEPQKIPFLFKRDDADSLDHQIQSFAKSNNLQVVMSGEKPDYHGDQGDDVAVSG